MRTTEHFVHACAGIAGVRFERPALMERTQGFKPLTLRLDQKIDDGVPAAGMCTDGPLLLVVSFVTQRHFSRTFVD